MSPAEPLWRRYLRLVRDDVRRDVDDEIRFHFDRLVEDEVATGVDRAQAERHARERMGDLTRARAQSAKIRGRGHRRHGRGLWFAGLKQDVWYGARSLRHTPLFTAAAALTLALGIGANAAVFSVLDGVALRPLPYGNPEGLVMLWEHNLVRNRARNVANPQNVLDWMARSRSFESIAGYAFGGITFTGGDVGERVVGRAVTPNFFDVLRVRPVVGRSFVATDTLSGAPRTIVLSHALWRRRFASDSSVVGRAVPIAGGTAAVVGVMPASFRAMGDEEYWQAWSLGPAGAQRSGRYMMVVARLREGVSVASAGAEMRSIGRALVTEYPSFNTGWTVDVVPMLDDVVGEASDKLWIALGAVTLVLLIACANVGNLILVRAAARQHEMAVRAALGAARGRLVRLWLAECGLLTLLGVALGLFVAWAGVRGLVALSPPDIPRLDMVRLNLRVVGFTALAAAAVAMVLGVGAALGARASASGALRETEARVTSGRRARRFRHALVVGQVALALVLLQGAGLLIQTLRRVEQVSPGFDPARLLTATVTLPSALYPEPAKWASFFRRTTERLRVVPGIADAGFVNAVPLTGIFAGTGFHPLDRPEPAPGERPAADIRIADEGYFRTLRLPVLRGRIVEPRDDTLPVVAVNQALASQLWPNGEALGKTLRVAWNRPDLPLTIIGVVGNTHSEGLDHRPRPTIYFGPEASPSTSFVMVVRGSGDAATLRGAIRRVISELDRAVAVHNVATMEERVSRSLAGRRSPAFLLTLFAGLALVLATVGLYGVLAYTVRLRAKEIGVRVALGARPASVTWLVVRSGLALGGLGIAIGGVAGLVATRAIRGLLFELSPSDSGTLLSVAVILLAAAALASWVPARRAARLDPAVAVRPD